MFQRQTSISYSTKTDLALNEEILVQFNTLIDKNLFLNLRMILVDAEKAIINIQH